MPSGRENLVKPNPRLSAFRANACDTLRGMRGVVNEKSPPGSGGLGNIKASGGATGSEQIDSAPSGMPAKSRWCVSRVLTGKARGHPDQWAQPTPLSLGV